MKRTIASISIFLIILNLLSATVYALEEEVNNFEESSLIEEVENEISEDTEKEEYDFDIVNEAEEFSLSISDGTNTINPYIKNGIYYLFVPKSIDLGSLIINYTGNIESIDNAGFDIETKQITGDFTNESKFYINLNDGSTKNVVIMQSDVPAIFINLDNDVTLSTVHSGSKSIKYKASVNVTGSNKDISQSNIEFKGRGNTTWKVAKRGYQIKLNKKDNFMGIGNSKEKKWVLIANYQDPTLLKNKIMNDICVNSGLSTCPNSDFADLYVNGDYIGNYLVCDKVEIKSNRVNLEDDKGLLMELDNAYYYEETYRFTSNRGNHYVVKESVNEEDSSIKAAMNSFKNALNSFENELYSDNSSWNKISKMIDVESFAKYYLVNEFAENTDSYYSSCYFYKDGDKDVIHMGPTWDYDASFGLSKGVERGEDPRCDYTINYAYTNVMQKLYTFPQFAKMVNEIFIKDVKESINNINVNELSNKYKNSIKMNTLVWSSESTYNNAKTKLNNFVEARKKYYSTRYSNQQIEYSTHVQDIGWLTTKRNGISGTEGQSKRIEGIRISIGNGFEDGISISYRTHVQDVGWLNWAKDGELAGTTGRGLRVEAIQLKLNGTSNYSIKYRVHMQDYGWSDWCFDGAVAGTTGQSKRIEAIEIQVIDAINRFGSPTINKEALISYRAHIQDVGDTGYGADGEIIGTSSRSLRMEGLQITLGKSLPEDMKIQIDEHIQDIGWKYELTNDDYIGTKGQSKRIEALALKLNGEGSENYTIKYRVHIQDIGWQAWKADGQIAGTTGQSKRIEAIQIKIEEKN